MITKSTRTILYAAALLGATAMQATPAFAQATRTWVSGVGDDVNPCSRTAPCKTFAGAISKTANGGEINCLDPAGYGAVTINKSLVIDCHYTEGGALAGGNGIVVNATSTDVVVLRGLDIFGVNPPTHGIRILVAGAVLVEDCVIRRFNLANSFGISFVPSGTTNLYVINTRVTQNGIAGSGGGITVAPTGTGAGRVMLRNVDVEQNPNHGVFIDTSATSSGATSVDIESSNVSGNGNGISILTTAGTSNTMVNDTSVAHNSLNGIIANGPLTVRVGNSTITDNAFTAGSAVVAVNGASALSYLNNRLDGNTNNGAFTNTIPPH
ncbi:MAG: hypothetical protein QOJ94_85 [Sphingomonadales bacterium]|jgi:hypothetical protein|nr:hypothetical protein [Sphingomonadales bacterium]